MYSSLTATLFIGKKIIVLPECDSTNAEALYHVEKENPPEGTLVITDNQTAGKGQRGNTWESAPGKNLTFSLILNPKYLAAQKQFDLNIFIALGILDYLKRLGSGFQVKWPNDLYHMDQKICGILIQNFLKGSKINTSIMGVGLNINQLNFNMDKATSLHQITGKEYSLPQVLDDVCQCIEARYLEFRGGHADRLRKQYLDNLYWFGEEHIFSDGEPFSGRITGISDMGKLQIETHKGIKYFDLKEVSFLS